MSPDDLTDIKVSLGRIEQKIEDTHKDIRRINGTVSDNVQRITAVETSAASGRTATSYHKWLIGLGAMVIIQTAVAAVQVIGG